MSECLGFQTEHVAMLAKHEEEISELKKKADKQDEVSDAVIEIKTFIKYFKEDAERREQQRIIDSEKRDAMMEKQSVILAEISNGLKSTQENLSGLECKVDKLEDRFDQSEDKNIIKIDTRDENKKRWVKRYVVPIGSILAAIALLYEILKIFKVF